MKKLFTIVLVLMLSLTVVGSVFAREETACQCPDGMVEVTPATVVPEVPGVPSHKEHRHWIGTTYKCPPLKTSYTYANEQPGGCSRWINLADGGRVRQYAPMIEDVPAHWGEWEDGPRHGEDWRKQEVRTIPAVPAIPGYCTDLVCRDPDEVIVGVRLRCAAEDSEGTVWQLIAGVRVDPAGGATLTFDGTDYTSSQSFHTNFGNHEWSAVASTDFVISGSSGGSRMIMRKDCNEPGAPPVHISTGPSGQPINLPLVVLMGLIGVSALSAGLVVVKRSRQ